MSDRPYITCRELIEFLHLYVSGELPPDRVEEFERHLSVCPSCVNYLQTYRDTIALGKAAFEDPDRPAEECAPEELVSAVLRARRGGNGYLT
jgi:anti-sigma factor RsiW